MDLGLRVQGLGLTVEIVRFGIKGLGIRVLGLGFGIERKCAGDA